MPESIERITIEGFGGIERLELTVRPFTVLIGPQSVGKSVVAKLIFFFRSISNYLLSAALGAEPPSARDVLLKQFARLFPSPTHGGGTARISYTVGNFPLRLSHDGLENSEWKMSLPLRVTSIYHKLVNEIGGETEDDDNIASNELAVESYFKRIEQFWPGGGNLPRFVPAGRAFYSQIESDAASYYESASIDPFVSEFGKFLSRLKRPRRRREYLPSSTSATWLGERLISGQYQRRGNEEFILSDDGRALPPRLWSSGQQEAQPLALLLQSYCFGFFSPTYLFIEEPEAHLFPSSQRLITELLSLTFNARQPGMRMFVTTHSPYILSTVNNLLLAGQLHQRKLSRKIANELAKISPKENALPPDSVGAFFMDRSGCRSLIDPETGLIESNAIDGVSADLSEQFDVLLQIDRQ